MHPPATARRRVLLIQNEPKLARAYSGVLVAAGFDVAESSCDAQAFETVERRPFDVVVADVSIPGSDWIDLVRQLCRRIVDVSIILMLDAPDNDLAVRGLEAGAQQYLVKPVGAEALARAVVLAVNRLQKASAPHGPRPSGGPPELLSFTATQAKNEFAKVLETVLKGHRVAITRHDAPKAVMVPYADFQAIADWEARRLDTLSAEFDELLARMQASAARAGMKAAFQASPAKLGKAAVAAARRRG